MPDSSTVQLFQRKNVRPIRAEQYLPANGIPNGLFLSNPGDTDQRPFITTVHGPVRVNVGDWIVYGSTDTYPVNNDAFRQLYEPHKG